MMSQAMRKLTGAIAKSRTTVIFINQIREKIGVMFGSPETTPGGRALKFYCSCRVDVRRISTLKEGENTIGIRIKAKIVKNKVAPPFRTAEFDMLGHRGISLEGDVIDLAIEDQVVDRSGTWLSFGDIRLGQGRDKARTYLEENPEVLAKIKQKVLESRGYAARVPQESASDGEPSE
jgi:recombination protein RecA